MSKSPVRQILTRLQVTRHRRVELSVAAYCTAFGVDPESED